jgi:hypothetical protein
MKEVLGWGGGGILYIYSRSHNSRGCGYIQYIVGGEEGQCLKLMGYFHKRKLHFFHKYFSGQITHKAAGRLLNYTHVVGSDGICVYDTDVKTTPRGEGGEWKER